MRWDWIFSGCSDRGGRGGIGLRCDRACGETVLTATRLAATGAGGEDGHAKFPFCILFFVLLPTALAGDAAGSVE